MRTSASNSTANGEGLPSVIMRRGPAPLPPLDLPPGVSLRAFEGAWGPAAWEHIVNTAFERNMSFDEVIRPNPAFRPERILFLEQGGVPVAVAAAWQRDRDPPGTGYLHYVAVLPGTQGQGLGYWVSLAALHQMRREGNTLAILETQDERLSAIKTYFRLGFSPDLTGHESYPARWEKILAQLRW